MTKCEICGFEKHNCSYHKCQICGKTICDYCLRRPRGLTLCPECTKELHLYIKEINDIEDECDARIAIVDEKIRELVKYE